MILAKFRLLSLSAIFCLTSAEALASVYLQSVRLEFPEVSQAIVVPFQTDFEPKGDPLSLPTKIVVTSDILHQIEIDAQILGYTFVDANVSPILSRANSIKQSRYAEGTVYSWHTPRRGSSFFSYICQERAAYCFKVGPYTLRGKFIWSELQREMLK